jgi:hypothetical protein
MGIAHQRAADALARVMEARTGRRYVGIVKPRQADGSVAGVSPEELRRRTHAAIGEKTDGTSSR